MGSTPSVSVLLVEDNPDDAQFVERLLTEHGRTSVSSYLTIAGVDHVDCLAAARTRVASSPPDVVLLDLMLPDSAGLSTVTELIDVNESVPIVVLTGRADADIGLEAIRRGAQDYLVKDSVTDALLFKSIGYAIERAEITRTLRNRTQHLEILNRIVSTEIHSDVNVIIGYGKQLEAALGADSTGALEGVLDAASHALELTTMATDLSAVLTGNVGDAPVDMSEILTQELTRFCETYGEGDVRLSSSVPEEAVMIHGHPLVSSMCRELLENAAMHSDRRPAEIDVSLSLENETVCLEIADEGHGISPRQRRLLTDPESRFQTDAGMRAGLYLVTTVVDQLSGTFTLETNDPRGTVAVVKLPLCTAA